MRQDIIDSLMQMAYDTVAGIGIRFEEQDLRKWNRALLRLESEVQRQAQEIPRLHAIDYRHLLVGNIMTGKHMGSYASYHPRYQAWKEQRSGGGYWRLFGDLVQAIGHFRISPVGTREYAWFAGVPVGKKDSGGKSWFGTGRGRSKSIVWYGSIMEFGGKFGKQTHPARPIFEPTFQEYLGSGASVNRAETGFMNVAKCWR